MSISRRNHQVGRRLGAVSANIAKFQKSLLEWYESKGRKLPWRRASASCYERIVSEVLLQRTRAETVASFLPGFIRRFPCWTSLAKVRRTTLEEMLKPLGLWRRRAVALQELAKTMTANKGRFPVTRDEIESLPAVGQYVASAVLLFRWQQPAPLLDVNMARVLERCFGRRELADIRYDPWLQSLSMSVVHHERSAEINWAILDLAAQICTLKNPRCIECPVNRACQTGKRLMLKLRQRGLVAR